MENILYKKTKYGIKEWNINVVDNKLFSTITIQTGLVNGKKNIFNIDIKNGKNIGKSNETSHYQQAILISKSKWNNKIKDGYTVIKDLDKKHLVYPMLAHDFNKYNNRIQFPCYIQRKLDGIRAIYENKTLHSRKLLLFPHLSHILDELDNIKDKCGNKSKLILDGELYSDDLSFQEISGIVRKEKLSKLDLIIINKIQFRVYDLVDNIDYIERYSILKLFFKKNNFKNIKLVQSMICNTKEELYKYHNSFVDDGYEGLIARNYIGKYEQDTRSYNLQKYKTFDDSEFVIVNYKDGVGIDKEAVIWSCMTSDNKVFDVKQKASIIERRKLFKHGKDYIGQKLNVKYFGFTNDGIPRFPIGLYIRNIDY